MTRSIKSPLTLAALNALTVAGHMKRPALAKAISTAVGHDITDAEFEHAIAGLGRRVMRVRGGGRMGGFWLA